MFNLSIRSPSRSLGRGVQRKSFRSITFLDRLTEANYLTIGAACFGSCFVDVLGSVCALYSNVLFDRLVARTGFLSIWINSLYIVFEYGRACMLLITYLNVIHAACSHIVTCHVNSLNLKWHWNMQMLRFACAHRLYVCEKCILNLDARSHSTNGTGTTAQGHAPRTATILYYTLSMLRGERTQRPVSQLNLQFSAISSNKLIWTSCRCDCLSCGTQNVIMARGTSSLMES